MWLVFMSCRYDVQFVVTRLVLFINNSFFQLSKSPERQLCLSGDDIIQVFR